jgi:patatin-like phospholipase/acyl hydrolase
MAKPKIKILSIDGGGIRGIIPCTVLAEIERLTGKPVSKLFDLIAGTSTGGIIACGLSISDPEKPSKSRYSAADLGLMYEKSGSKIFQKKGGVISGITKVFEEAYTQTGLETMLTQYFGDTELAQTRTEILITSYDIEKRKPFYFLSRLAKAYPDTENFLLRDLARATSAAPTYFEPEKIQWQKAPLLHLIDGGVFANNPAMLAYTEGIEMLRQRQATKNKSVAVPSQTASRGFKPITLSSARRSNDIFMLSLGTGQVTKAYKYKDACSWGLAEWVRPCIDILMQGVSEAVDYQMQYVLPPGKDGMPYYIRLNPEIPEANCEMSDVSSKNLEALKNIAHELVAKEKYWIEATCEMLV